MANVIPTSFPATSDMNSPEMIEWFNENYKYLSNLTNFREYTFPVFFTPTKLSLEDHMIAVITGGSGGSEL